MVLVVALAHLGQLAVYIQGEHGSIVYARKALVRTLCKSKVAIDTVNIGLLVRRFLILSPSTRTVACIDRLVTGRALL